MPNKNKKSKKTMREKVTGASSAIFGRLKSRVELYIGIFTLVGMIFGAPYFLDNHYAKASDQQNTASKLEQKILEDKYSAIESHIWSIQDRFKNLDKAPKEVRDELRDLQNRKDRIKSRLDVLDKQLGVLE